MKLQGTAFTRQPVIAPLSERPCVLYKLTLEYISDYDRVNRNRELRETYSVRCSDDAALADATGRIPINPQEARLHLRSAVSANAGFGASAQVEHLIRDMIPSSHYLPRRLVEERLEEGEPILAIGQIEPTPGGPLLSGGYRLELWSGGEQGMASVNRSVDLIAFGLMIGGVLFVGGAWFLQGV